MGSEHNLGKGLSLRPAKNCDSMLLYGWANEPDSLEGKLLTKGPKNWREHEAWFQNRLSDAWGGIWIASCGAGAIGQVRLQFIDDAFEVNYDCYYNSCFI